MPADRHLVESRTVATFLDAWAGACAGYCRVEVRQRLWSTGDVELVQVRGEAVYASRPTEHLAGTPALLRIYDEARRELLAAAPKIKPDAVVKEVPDAR